MTTPKKLMFDYSQFEAISKPEYSIRMVLPGKVKLSEAKLHIKASPLKSFIGDVVSIKRLYMFKNIRIYNYKGIYVTNNKLPAILELDDDYSIKFSDIAGYDDVFENIDITLTRNDLPFEIYELWIEYNETEEEPSKIIHNGYDLLYDPNDDKTNSYKFYFENDINSDIKIYNLFTHKDIYYVDKKYIPNDYLKDVEYILVDNLEPITNRESFKPIEEYKGHNVVYFFKYNALQPILYIRVIQKFNI